MSDTVSRAAENGHATVDRLLVEKGANIESKDYYGRTPHPGPRIKVMRR